MNTNRAISTQEVRETAKFGATKLWGKYFDGRSTYHTLNLISASLPGICLLLLSLKRRETPELLNGSWFIHWIMQHNRGQENKKLWIYTSSLTLNPRLAVHSLSSRHGVIRVHCVGMIFIGSSVPWKDEPGQNRDVLLAATGTAATSTGQRTGQNERAYAKNTWLATNPSTCYIVNIIFIDQKSVYIEI